MKTGNLESNAAALVAPGKGILAADESHGTIAKRFASIDVVSTEESRRAYREVILAAPGLGRGISGVILFDETIRQTASDGRRFVDVLEAAGILPGIKVDLGAKPLAGFPGERITEGLDGLRERLAEYADLGARFTKWRAVIAIGGTAPTRTCLDANAEALARFAALSQEAGLVPIVEPEVLMDGGHPIERHDEVTGAALQAVFRRLREHRVLLEGMLLKPNMVLPGTDCAVRADARQVAETTVRRMKRDVPAAVPGLMFLSGGQGDVEATANLDAMNRIGGPWQLSFSFGRALQAPALRAWGGEASNTAAARQALLHRVHCNAAARHGDYGPAVEEADRGT